MSLIATVALAAVSAHASGAVLPQCSWDKPGANPFMGDVVAAVDRYSDIPTATRTKLKARMKARTYEDIAVIGRNSITGKADYADDIRDMHFGAGSICRTVTRTQWTSAMQERGLVYCEDGHCILVPTVCRNVSRITRLAPARAAGPGQGDGLVAAGPEQEPLNFDAPSAGPSAEELPGSFAQIAGASLSPDNSAGGVAGGNPSAGNLSGGNLSGGNLSGGGSSGGGSSGSFASSVSSQPLAAASGFPLSSASPAPFGRARTPSNPEIPITAVAVIPEPSTWALMLLGLLALTRWSLRQGR
jgi:hypothetical protein